MTSRKYSFGSKDVPYENPKGLHWLLAVVFVLGDMVGGGMIVLPSVLVNSGLYLGLTLLLVSGAVATFTAWQLSAMWTFMQKKWPEYQEFCRKPYCEMALRACGSKMRTFLSTFLILNQFGFGIVLILLAAKNVSILINFFFSLKISFCYLIILVGLIVWPMTMLKSPMHFWPVAVFSALSSSIGVILIFYGILHDSGACLKTVSYPSFNLQKFFMAIGTLGFALGGHTAFPTIQHDMKRPAKFKFTILCSFAVILTYYCLVSVGGSIVYGDSLGDNIIPSIQVGWVQQTVNSMIAIHVLTTIIIAFSPMTQLFEDYFNCPHRFGWQRFLIRTVILWFLVFIALSVPNFGPLVDLIGGLTGITTSWILPPILYLFMMAKEKRRQELLTAGKKSIHLENITSISVKEVLHYSKKPILAACLFCIAFGTITAGVSTVASTIKLLSAEVAAPCYVQYFKTGLPLSDFNSASVNCCGAYKNTTVTDTNPVGYCNAVKQ